LIPLAAEPPSFPISHVLNLVAVVRRWRVTADDLLDGMGVPPQSLADPRARVSVPTMVKLLERARTLTREPALGMHIGLGIRPTLYGNLGFALMSASNIREAIDLTIRFGPLVTTALRVRLHVAGRVASLTLDELADFGSARDIVVIGAIIATRQIGVVLADRELTTSVAELAIPEPWYAAKLVEAGFPMRFDCPLHRLTFDARSLDVPYTMSNPSALALARDHCQRELDRFGPGDRVSDSVRGLLSCQERGCPSLEEVAAALHQSPRTLKRRLAEEGVSFSALREVELRERAITLVRTSEASYSDIAARLGYSDVTSFERAFRRWVGSTPAECRRAATPSRRRA
jgi:AraC-like DNA-binding protein